MRILITNSTLDLLAGSELYVRDLAIALLKRGHTPIAYSTVLGTVADEIRAATIPVIDNLDALTVPPDVIHGHHHFETMTALIRFPGVPALYVCHGWLPWEENPPLFPRIRRYVAVDHTCLDRLILESGIPADRTRVLLNFVDLARFSARGPLPERPQRALVFSNRACEATQIPAIREACRRFGISLDVIGQDSGRSSARPEDVLGSYDLVFAKGRAALESLAVGTAVILCDATGLGPMVTSGEFERLRPLNFGLRTLQNPLEVEALGKQIERYNAEDATKVSQTVRASAGLDEAVERIISLYEEVIAENKNKVPNPEEESRVVAGYMRFLAPKIKYVHEMKDRALAAESVIDGLRGEYERLSQTVEAKERETEEINLRLSETYEDLERLRLELGGKETQLQRINNSLGWRLLSKYGPVKYRILLPAYQSIRRVFNTGRSINRRETLVTGGKEEPPSPTKSVAGQKAQRGQPSSMREIFSDIHHQRSWGPDCESVSGPGSSVERTSSFRDAIARLLMEMNVRVLLDAGCGDFNWMRLLNSNLDRYIGIDVVPDLIERNQRKYGNEQTSFLNADFTSDKLCRADLILGRDCLVHLSLADALSALRNFRASGSTYLLTTTFLSLDENTDISTGGWRQLNLQKSPFNFPEPIKLINENRPFQEGFSDKHLGLWALQDITV